MPKTSILWFISKQGKTGMFEYNLLDMVKEHNVMLEEYARRMITQEEMHLCKMLKKTE
jgi:hypothetical protein